MNTLKITKHVVDRMIDRFPNRLSEDATQEALSGSLSRAKEEVRMIVSQAKEDRKLANNPYLIARSHRAGRENLTYVVHEGMVFSIGVDRFNEVATVTNVFPAEDFAKNVPGTRSDVSDSPLAQALIKAGLSRTD